MKPQITFVTGNAFKADQVGWHLDMPLAHQKVDVDEIQSLDLAEVVRHKAMGAYKIIKTPVLVEDTSLTFESLGRLPGPLIKWFLEELDNVGLVKLLDGYPSRRAEARVLFGYFDGKEFQIFSGGTKGTIAPSPRGERGFGWDPIFIPDGHVKTWGEMTKEEQIATSMRRKALKKLAKAFK